MSPKALAITFALLVALCWGLYGPTLSQARSPTKEWSNFKPYVFIGVAYLVIAIFGGAVMMKLSGDSFSYSGPAFGAAKWGFLAGTLGALGAMFLTYAVVKTAGHPALVMPYVFGGAVTVNALTSYILLRSKGVETSPLLWLGMVITIVGVSMIAAYTPHGAGKPKPEQTAAVETTDAETPAEPVVG